MRGNSNFKPSYERGEQGSISLLVSVAAGFSLLWVCFFLVTLHDPFVSAWLSNDGEWGWSLLPVASCVGFVTANVVILRLCDYFASERGHRALRAIIVSFPILPSALLFMRVMNDVAIPNYLLLVAWFGIGIGFGCLLQLWGELLAGFTKGFASKVLCSSIGAGGLGYFISSSLPLPVGILVVCIAPSVSLGLLYLLEREIPPAPFVSREESLVRHKLARSIDALNTFYSIVFGLAIHSLSLAKPSLGLYFGISAAVVAGAALMLPLLAKNNSHMMHGEVQRLLFPLLVLGLLPMPFVSADLQVLCMLAIVISFVCLLIAGLDSLLCLVKRYELAPMYLVGRGMSPMLVGIAFGFAVGAFVSNSSFLDDSLFPLVSLGLVVVLSLIVTFIRFDVDHLAEEDAALAEEAKIDTPEGVGRWKARCAVVAKEAGLSARETEVFFLLAKGHGNSYIQEKFCISPHTVKAHVYNIYKKMDIGSREELLHKIETASIVDEGENQPS